MKPRWIKHVAAWTGRVFRAGTTTQNLRDFVLGLFPRGEGNQIARPMEVSTAVYSGIRAIAQTIARLPLVLYRGERDNLVTRGPAFDLVNRPMRGMTGGQFREQWAGHLIEGGEAHVLLQRDAAGRKLTGIQVVGRRQIEPILDSQGALLGWRYTPQGGAGWQAVLPDEDVYSRLFNPYDALRGLGPLQAAALGLRQDYSAALFNAAALENGGQPGGLYVHPGTPGDDERKELAGAIRERHSGPGNANLPGFLWGGMDYKETSFKNTDLALFEGMRYNATRVFNVLGVPPVIVAIYETAHYDVADKSIEIFLTYTIAPLVGAHEDALNLTILPLVEPGVQCYLDVSGHPVMQRLQWGKLESLAKAIENGTPYNEAIKFLSLPLQALPWGDASLLKSTLTRAEDVLSGAGGGVSELPLPAENGGAGSGEQGSGIGDRGSDKTLLPSAPIPDPRSPIPDLAAVEAQRRDEQRQVEAAAPAIKRRFKAYFARVQREYLARLRRAIGKGSGSGDQGAARLLALPDPRSPIPLVERVMLRITVERETLAKLANSYFPEAARRTLLERLAALGVPEDQRAAIAERLMGSDFLKHTLRIKALRIGGIARTTQEAVRKTLLDGLDHNETIDQLSERVRAATVFDQARANRIARAEAGQAVSTARFMAAAGAGLRGKAWLTGANPRPTHILAGQDYPALAAIELTEYFSVGDDRLLYPRDPAGSAGEILNCNCVQLSAARPAA